MNQHDQEDDLAPYRFGPLSLLELMMILAFLGVFLSWLIPRFFI